MSWTLHSFKKNKLFTIFCLDLSHCNLNCTHLLCNVQISLCKGALLFGPVSDGISNFNDTGASGLKDGIKAIDNLHPAGFVSAALPNVDSLGKNATKVLFPPSAAVCQAFGEHQ